MQNSLQFLGNYLHFLKIINKFWQITSRRAESIYMPFMLFLYSRSPTFRLINALLNPSILTAFHLQASLTSKVWYNKREIHHREICWSHFHFHFHFHLISFHYHAGSATIRCILSWVVNSSWPSSARTGCGWRRQREGEEREAGKFLPRLYLKYLLSIISLFIVAFAFSH